MEQTAQRTEAPVRSDLHASRRRRLMERLGESGAALFVASPERIRSSDTHYPYRPHSDLWYLTGFDHPGATAVLRTDGGPAYTLFVEPRDRALETWTGYRPGVEGAVQDFGADEAYPNTELAAKIPDLIRGAKRIYHVLGRDAALDAQLVAALEQMRLRSRTNAEPADTIVDPRSITHPMRLFKEPSELDLMRRAAEISREGHAAGVVGIGADLADAAHDDLVDVLGCHTRPFEGGLDGGGAEFVRRYVLEDATEAADRGPCPFDDDDRFRCGHFLSHLLEAFATSGTQCQYRM